MQLVHGCSACACTVWAATGRHEDALRVLQLISRVNRVPLPHGTLEGVARSACEVVAPVQGRAPGAVGTPGPPPSQHPSAVSATLVALRALLGPRYRRTSLCLWFIWVTNALVGGVPAPVA
jgi:hypothetical protein